MTSKLFRCFDIPFRNKDVKAKVHNYIEFISNCFQSHIFFVTIITVCRKLFSSLHTTEYSNYDNVALKLIRTNSCSKSFPITISANIFEKNKNSFPIDFTILIDEHKKILKPFLISNHRSVRNFSFCFNYNLLYV